jgi:hypothetical protein
LWQQTICLASHIFHRRYIISTDMTSITFTFIICDSNKE